jgi:hypothetical protein
VLRLQCSAVPGAESNFGQRLARGMAAVKKAYSGSFSTMNPTAKPVKKNKKAEPAKKLERKNPLMSVRSLTVKW